MMLLLLLGAPVLAQDDDDDEESSIEIEVEEEDEPEPEPDKTPNGLKKTAQKKKIGGTGEPTWLTDSRGAFSIELPGNWGAEEREAKEGHARFDLDFGAGAEVLAWLSLETQKSALDPRAYPHLVRAQRIKEGKSRKIRIAHKLLPHLVSQTKFGDRNVVLIETFHFYLGRPIIVSLALAPDEFEANYETFLKVALTAKMKTPPWPVIPERYKIKKKGGITYAVHPGVSASLKNLIATTQDAKKRFERFHGKLPRPPKGSNGAVIYVHANQEEVKRSFNPDLEDTSHPFLVDSTSLRAFALPVQEDDRTGSMRASTGMVHFLARRYYGVEVPRWVTSGESSAASVQFYTDKKLPWITAGHRSWSDGIQLPMLNGYKADEGETAGRKSFFYVVFFRRGPSKYRKAYRAFLKDIATRYDPDAAAARHLEPLGYSTIQSAATKFMFDGLKITKD